ncbi:hypothetical protein LXA43DRAFT_1066945 [Ganoderma leucocontextum]|nr:hypothetical protein LXA43DRAFT_1066945 [Ganoderma leucocontextum]
MSVDMTTYRDMDKTDMFVNATVSRSVHTMVLGDATTTAWRDMDMIDAFTNTSVVNVTVRRSAHMMVLGDTTTTVQRDVFMNMSVVNMMIPPCVPMMVLDVFVNATMPPGAEMGPQMMRGQEFLPAPAPGEAYAHGTQVLPVQRLACAARTNMQRPFGYGTSCYFKVHKADDTVGTGMEDGWKWGCSEDKVADKVENEVENKVEV